MNLIYQAVNRTRFYSPLSVFCNIAAFSFSITDRTMLIRNKLQAIFFALAQALFATQQKSISSSAATRSPMHQVPTQLPIPTLLSLEKTQ
jgi:hypothetical protein